MKNKNEQKHTDDDGNDDLRAENALIRLRLEMDHGMTVNEASEVIDPLLEHQWLSSILHFEEQFQKGRRIKVYDFLNQPQWISADALSPEEITQALRDMLTLMESRGIALDYGDGYEDEKIYRFLTMELFEKEMDDIAVEGMVHHFIYEEFYPDYAESLKDKARYFLETLMRNDWDQFSTDYYLSDEVVYNGKRFDKNNLAAIITLFQTHNANCELIKWTEDLASFDLLEKKGAVHGTIKYSTTSERKLKHYEGNVMLDFDLIETSWSVSGISMPGLGDQPD